MLLLATNYITQLSDTLQRGGASQPSLPLHPVKVSLAASNAPKHPGGGVSHAELP